MADTRWISLPPPGVHPGQYKAGTNIELSDGVVVRVVGQSTQMLLVRPLPWWERLLRRLTHRGTS